MEWNLTTTYDPTLDEDVSTITVTAQGKGTWTARRDHPNFAEIVKAQIRGVLGEPVGEDEVLALFDIAKQVESKFARLSDRIAVRDGKIYFDNDEVQTGLARQVLEFYSQGVEDWRPLVNFWEKLSSNPNDHSRKQFWDFVNNHKVTVFPDGDFVGYKGCRRGEDGVLYSTTQGHAIVDGEDLNGLIPNRVGSIVEMPRSEVKHDPDAHCHAGLHIGTFDFASSYASRGSTLITKVNPRDVVSVPNDVGGQKTRVCRYEVIDEDIKEELVESLVGHDYEENRQEAEEAVQILKKSVDQVIDAEIFLDATSSKEIHSYVVEVGFDLVEDQILSDILVQAVQKAKRAKKSAVLLREMEREGYEPKPGLAPTPSTTSPEDWQPTSAAQAEQAQEPDVDPETSQVVHPTQRELDEVSADAKSRKKGLVSWMRRAGWHFVTGDFSTRTAEEAKLVKNWVKNV